ncbi:glycosyl hydrolase family 28-related protein [Kitasatospora viridis]|uniref:Pectate lyase-like protein n=1 Tax=Kitasatospora viridis TaxID=281105 RepID=A0A561SA03_9ACTN|nr:glycosyl hydrolase family 28-related protein [Kitasatospora viridis]TWF71634.1 pectate lyase-like protein [Kitasatospora viridis]
MRAHFSRPYLDSAGNRVPQAQVRILEAGTNVQISETIYTDGSTGAVKTNPFFTNGGDVSFYLDAPSRVKIGITSPGNPEEFWEDLDVTAPGLDSVHAGSGANSMQVGSGAAAAGVGATATGVSAAATGKDSAAAGRAAQALADVSSAYGANTSASAAGATAVGASAGASAPSSTALGFAATARHASSTAVGAGAATTAPGQVMLGTPTDMVEVAGSFVVRSAGGKRWLLQVSDGGLLATQAAPTSDSGTAGGSAGGAGTVTVLRWVSPRDFGAKADGVSDDTAALQAALNVCPKGGTVYLLPAVYRTSAPLYIPPSVTLLGSHANIEQQAADVVPATALRPLPIFSGNAVVRIVDQVMGSYSELSREQQICDLTIDGRDLAASPAVDGVQLAGNVQGVQVRGLNIQRVSGHGLRSVVDAFGANTPIGLRAQRVVVYKAALDGFNLASPLNSTFVDCESLGATGNGWSLSNPGGATLSACRSGWSGKDGFLIAPGLGPVGLVGCTTDRSNQHGIRIVAGDGSVVNLSGCRLYRDGRNNGAGGGGGWAGLAVISTTCPVVADGLTVTVGADDSSTSGGISPQYGVHADHSRYVSVSSGLLAATDTPWHDGGGNELLLRGPNVTDQKGRSGTEAVRTVPGLRVTTSSLAFTSAGGLVSDVLNPDVVLPSDHGLIAWSQDPGSVTANSAFGAGVVQLIKIVLRAPRTVTNIVAQVVTGGSGLTTGQCWVGLYDATGNLVGSTADQATSWQSGGPKFMALVGGPVVLPAGSYWVALLANGTTLPTFTRGSSVSAAGANINLTAATARWGTVGSGLQTLPSNLAISSIVLSSSPYWAALG